jgi:hypothetical protein
MTSKGQLRRARGRRFLATMLIVSVLLGATAALSKRIGEMDERERWLAASTTVERAAPVVTFKWTGQ